jgi:membrane-associated protease RseP (regulator of RpoE activity)
VSTSDTENEAEPAWRRWARAAILPAALVAVAVLGGRWTLFLVAAIVVMIFLHELGHYLMAKWAGMKVTEFFLGFGPRIWSFRRGETVYGVKAIPAGAYVKIIGMHNLEEVDPADEDRTYRAKPTWRRLTVAVAGSTMHFILAFVLVCIVVMGFGLPRGASTTLAGVPDGPARNAGIRAGDKVVGFDGHDISSWDQLATAIRARGNETVEVVVERDGVRRTVRAALETTQREGRTVGYLGVSPAARRVRLGPWDGVKEMGSVAKESFVGLGHLFSPSGVGDYVDNLTSASHGDGRVVPGTPSASRPTSIIGVIDVGSQIAKDGAINVFYLLFAVNLFIGIFNLVPLLPFDGGHVVIALYEKARSMISGRRYQADVAKLMPLTYAVVLVLALLFVTTAYMDIVNPVRIK